MQRGRDTETQGVRERQGVGERHEGREAQKQ